MSVEIGKRLKQARETLGLTLEDIEAQTRIQRRYLQAIENGQFDLLPGPIYVRSYVRSYANIVGENPHALLKFYQSPVRSNQAANRFGETSQMDMRRRTLSLPSAEETMGRADRSSAPLSRTSRYPAMTPKQMEPPEESSPYSYRHSGSPYASMNSRGEDSPVHQPDYDQARSHLSYRERVHESGAYDEEEFRGAAGRSPAHSPRRPVMPPDVPAPEELGIEVEESLQGQQMENHDYPSAQPGNSDLESPSQYSRSKRDKKKEKTGSFGRVYTLLLILGAVALVIATLAFMWYRSENAQPNKNQQVAQPGAPGATKDEKPKGVPRLNVINTSPTGIDRYELVNADKLELKITWLKGSSSGFEIRDQEVGNPIVTGEVTSIKKEFVQTFSSDIWIKLLHPDQVAVTVNGQDIQTDMYTDEKDIHISFLN